MAESAPLLNNVEYDSSVPVVNKEQIEMLLMVTDPEELAALAGELFELYLSEAEVKIEDLDRVCSEGDLPELRKIVHFVAGSAGNLGMQRLCAFLRGVERAIDDGVFDQVATCAPVIKGEYEGSNTAFRTAFSL